MCAAVLKLVTQATADARPMSDLPALLTNDPWAAATDEKRRVADLRAALVVPLAALVQQGAAQNSVAEMFVAKLQAGRLDEQTLHLLALLEASEGVSAPTLKRWISAYLKRGKVGLIPQQTGRVRQSYGWEARAIELYNLPSKPGYAGTAKWLQLEGHANATITLVRAYLKSMPATLGENSPHRVGKHLHRLTRQRFQRRSVADLLVGEIYTGDGHTIDCYLAHPNTGRPWRPEFSAWLDIKSRYPVGWWLDEAESTNSTLFAISSALATHDHVPAWVYVDRGPGYRARLLAAENIGWYARWGIERIGALPGNPHGKGWIERWFRTIRDDHDKFFWDGEVYCGGDMAEEVNRRLSVEIDQGKRKLPTLADYVASLTRWIAHYCNTPLTRAEGMDGRTPAQVWAELQRVPLVLDTAALVRPCKEATVRRHTVRLDNRFYYHSALALFDGKRVRVEYDLHDDRKAWVFDDKGRHLCEATLEGTIGVLPQSRLEEGRDRREKAQLQRLERRADEVRARRADPLTAETQVKAIEHLAAGTELLPPLKTPAKEPVPLLRDVTPSADVLDIFDWRPSND